MELLRGNSSWSSVQIDWAKAVANMPVNTQEMLANYHAPWTCWAPHGHRCGSYSYSLWSSHKALFFRDENKLRVWKTLQGLFRPRNLKGNGFPFQILNLQAASPQSWSTWKHLQQGPPLGFPSPIFWKKDTLPPHPNCQCATWFQVWKSLGYQTKQQGRNIGLCGEKISDLNVPGGLEVKSPPASRVGWSVSWPGIEHGPSTMRAQS